MSPWQANGRTVAGDGHPRIMGIVNVTPDSFSDGGRWPRPRRGRRPRPTPRRRRGRPARPRRRIEPARRRAGLARRGTAPGHPRRRGASPQSVGVPISVDTTKAEVARRALAAGAAIVNDITALPAIPRWPASSPMPAAGVVLMHMAGHAQDHAGRPALRGCRRRGPRRTSPAASTLAERPGSPATGSPSTPASASARRSRTTWRSCGTSRDLRTWDVPCWSAPRARGSWARSPAGRSIGAGDGHASSRRWRRSRNGAERRPRPRRRPDGRCDQGLGAVHGWEELTMSVDVPIDRSSSTQCRDLADRAKAASRPWRRARGAAKDAWLTPRRRRRPTSAPTSCSRPTPATSTPPPATASPPPPSTA